jgi:hypothetical protein
MALIVLLLLLLLLLLPLAPLPVALLGTPAAAGPQQIQGSSAMRRPPLLLVLIEKPP